jgi:23S rRNA pseudouridine2605 synthase
MTRSSKQSAPNPAASESEADKPERVAKVIARAGLCSRRDAERWIEMGRVNVNGKPLITPAHTVLPTDIIEVDGKPLPEREPARLWRYHKPSGLVVSHRDEKDRASVFDKMPEELPRVISIGRLDINTEGLLLLTNDGGLARLLELPATGWVRRYRVRANGKVTPEALEALKDGLLVESVQYGPIEAKLDKEQGANVWLTIALREGKNREVKKICEHLGLKVGRLIRTSFGPFQLGELPRGSVDEVAQKVLNEQIRGGPKRAPGAKSKRAGEPKLGPDGKPFRKPRPSGKPTSGKASRGKPASGKPVGGKPTRGKPAGKNPDVTKPSGKPTRGKPASGPGKGAPRADRRR